MAPRNQHTDAPGRPIGNDRWRLQEVLGRLFEETAAVGRHSRAWRRRHSSGGRQTLIRAARVVAPTYRSRDRVLELPREFAKLEPCSRTQQKLRPMDSPGAERD